jgi:hypothetical protein
MLDMVALRQCLPAQRAPGRGAQQSCKNFVAWRCARRRYWSQRDQCHQTFLTAVMKLRRQSFAVGLVVAVPAAQGVVAGVREKKLPRR